MAFGAGVPGTHDVYPTIDDCYRVVHMEGSNVPGTNIDSTEAEETKRPGLNWHRGEMSSCPDRPNVDRKHEEELCNSDMAPRVEPGWTLGEPPSHSTDTDDVRISISICDRHGLHNTPREWRNAPDMQTARLRYSTYSGGSDERIPRNEDKATASGHIIDAGVEIPTYGLGMGGNRIHVLRRDTWYSAD